MQEGFEEIGKRVDWIAMIAIQGDYDVAGGGGESALVRASIAPLALLNHFRAQRSGDFGCAIGGGVIDHDDFVNEFRHGPQHLFNALLLIEARRNDCDCVAFIHGRPL